MDCCFPVDSSLCSIISFWLYSFFLPTQNLTYHIEWNNSLIHNSRDACKNALTIIDSVACDRSTVFVQENYHFSCAYNVICLKARRKRPPQLLFAYYLIHAIQNADSTKTHCGSQSIWETFHILIYAICLHKLQCIASYVILYSISFTIPW